MKRIYKYILPGITLMTFASCSVEAPFQAPTQIEYGDLSKLAFEMELAGDPSVVTRATNEVNMNDFHITIKTTGNNPQIKIDKDYSELPDILSLETGNYVVTATYGTDHEAEYDTPYYQGTSEIFEVKKNEITTNIGKIKCYLSNIKVTIKFHPNLVSHMHEKAYVEVKINEDGKPLNFNTSHEEQGIAGFFQHKNECSLVATFKGIVDGVELNEVKTLSNVNKGNHYQITFTRHEYNEEESGNLQGGIEVDASVTVTDINRDIEIEEDKKLEDNERPTESDTQNPGDGEEPGEEEDPGDVPMNGEGLDAKAEAPLDLESENIVNSESVVVVVFTSKTGFTKFEAEIISNDLTSDELEQIGLSSHLDLIEPGKNLEQLQSLGLMKDENGENDVDSVKGQKLVKFDLTNFMTPLSIFPGLHTFVLKIGDKSGEKEYTLKLNMVAE